MNEQRKLIPKILTKIAVNDNMLSKRSETPLADYFGVGMNGLSVICSALDKVNLKPKCILDMPSGYGRVTRFLRVAFPSAEIFVCDLDKKAVDFCSTTFDTKGIYSSEDFNDIVFPIDIKFDLIFVGSLITHLPSEKSTDFIKFCVKNLSRPGLLVLTFAGQSVYESWGEKRTRGIKDKSQIESAKLDYEKFGYGYVNYSGYLNYGVSIIKESYFANLSTQLGFEILECHQNSWGGQDVIVIKPA